MVPINSIFLVTFVNIFFNIYFLSLPIKRNKIIRLLKNTVIVNSLQQTRLLLQNVFCSTNCHVRGQQFVYFP